MKVRLTPRARRRAKLVASWWRENRPAAPHLFDDELRIAIEILAGRPDVGRIYREVGGDRVRRLLLPRSEQYVYYLVEQALDSIIIVTIWGARRGRGPKL